MDGVNLDNERWEEEAARLGGQILASLLGPPGLGRPPGEGLAGGLAARQPRVPLRPRAPGAQPLPLVVGGPPSDESDLTVGTLVELPEVISEVVSRTSP